MGVGGRGGQKSSPDAPTSWAPSAHKAQAPVQIPALPQAHAGENRLMAKRPRSQTKHPKCSQALQTAGSKGWVCSELTGTLVWARALHLGEGKSLRSLFPA